MFQPNFKHGAADDYIAFYCEDELATLYEKVAQQQAPSYTEDGITLYTITDEKNDVTVTIALNDKHPRTVPTKAQQKTMPDAAYLYVLNNNVHMVGTFFVHASSARFEDILTAVNTVDPTIAEDMHGRLRGAFSQEPDLMEGMAAVTSLLPAVETWLAQNDQVLTYTGKDDVKTMHELRPFIADYLHIFTMDGTLVLDHSGMNKTFMRQMEDGQPAWYCAERGYGYAVEQQLNPPPAGHHPDDDWDTNAWSYFQVKHACTDAHCIAWVIDGVLTPVSPHVDALALCVKTIVEDLTKANALVSTAPSV